MIWIKRIVWLIVGIILTVVAIGFSLNKTMPKGEANVKVERMVDDMWKSINHEAWLQTGAVSWDFGGRHQHVWDRERHLARVSWGEIVVLIDINRRVGVVLQGAEEGTGEELRSICYDAWKYWANDSFWLNPISKLRDPGTSRYLVEWEGRPAVLVSYDEGGVTPGDSYLWLLDEYGMPNEWRMWVQIIPVGGISTTWDDWITLSTGAKISTSHYNLLTLELTDVRGEVNLMALEGSDIFEPLLKSTELISF